MNVREANKEVIVSFTVEEEYKSKELKAMPRLYRGKKSEKCGLEAT